MRVVMVNQDFEEAYSRDMVGLYLLMQVNRQNQFKENNKLVGGADGRIQGPLRLDAKASAGEKGMLQV